MSNHGIRFTELGSCRDGSDKFTRCAWEPDDCEAGETFTGTDQDTKIMKKCNPNDQPIGRCVLEDECALRASDCRDNTSSSNFNDEDPTCSIQRDKAVKWDTSNPQYTQFGSCKDIVTDEHFCIYNPSDCDESGTEVYATPAETLAAGVICDCKEVHLGACVTTSLRSFCAINELGCRDGWPYYSPHVQRVDREDGVGLDGTTVDCRLCSRKNTAEPTASPTTRFQPTSRPTSNPTPSSSMTPTIVSISTLEKVELTESSMATKSNNGLGGNTSAIIGGAVGGVVLLGLMAFFYVKTFRNIKQKTIRRSRRRKPPTLEISYS